jgi:hypothetical protein
MVLPGLVDASRAVKMLSCKGRHDGWGTGIPGTKPRQAALCGAVMALRTLVVHLAASHRVEAAGVQQVLCCPLLVAVGLHVGEPVSIDRPRGFDQLEGKADGLVD